VIDSGAGEVALALDLRPGEWGLGDVEHPAVIDALVPNVASEDDEVGLGVGEGVSVPLPRGAFADVDDVPDADSLADIEVEEVVRGQSSRASGSSIDDDLVGLDADCAVGSPSGGRRSSGCVGTGVLSTFFQKREVRSRV
jgi:hypothetical protein